MQRIWLSLLAVLAAGGSAHAQESGVGRCATPDSVAIVGNARVTTQAVRATAGLSPSATLTPAAVQSGIRALYGTGQYEDVRIACIPEAGGTTILQITVRERPVLGSVTVEGTDVVSEGTIRDRISLAVGQPVNPQSVAEAVAGIDSIYQSRGYYLATVGVDSTVGEGRAALAFTIDEGSRLAVSGIQIAGNERVSSGDIVDAMTVKPEGFLWFRRGAFDEDEFAADVGQRIPGLYAARGFIDAQVVQDTLIVDPELGKALVRLTIQEGEQYKVGRFDVVGNQRFSSDDIQVFYPFDGEGPTVTQRVTDFVMRRGGADPDVFDQAAWTEATQNLITAYNNEGYISAVVQPVVDRTVGEDSVPVVNLRWDIIERNPSIINRVDIVGNDYTEESCIRRQLSTVPGDVFNRDRLLRSYNSIANLGFFDAPLPPPDVQQANADGDVNIIFEVEEKQTGNVNFGASMGQGTGVGGFIGLDQPNLFGKCKRGSVQWQFGRFINDANVSYTDPAIRESQYSGTVTAYRSQARYNIADLGRSLRTGGSLRIGLPIPRSPFARAFVSYGGESVEYGEDGLLGQQDSLFAFGRSFRSSLGLDVTRDTRIDLPFASAGALTSISAQFNGGPLGGTADFQRYTTEMRGYAQIGQFGGDRVGSQPIKFVVGLTGRAGAVIGDPGAFFAFSQFALGGVQFGEQLRGYPEFSITPDGFLTDTDNFNAQRNSFGNAFFTTTAELGVRVNQSLYVNTFFDAGNVWRQPRQFDPTRLFRGAGIGVSTITPLGPLGLDYAYGFDRYRRGPNNELIPAPQWQLHFRLGQLF